MEYIDCPTCQKRDEVRGYGKFRRSSDRQEVQRFKCQRCCKTFSRATIDPEYCQKKRQINYTLERLLASVVSQRRAAIILNVNRKTVARRIPFFGELCKKKVQKSLKEFVKKQPVTTLQLDELQTIEHTKCKPLSVAVVVNPDTRHILGVNVSTMPATGKLAKLSRQKYGYRPDKRQEGLQHLLNDLPPIKETLKTVKSDEHPYYPPLIRKEFPSVTHLKYKGDPPAVMGQGELKKNGFDPLFCINHTLAMMRANICRLIRKTWCTTKKKERLLDHLWIYCWIHNQFLVPVPIRG